MQRFAHQLASEFCEVSCQSRIFKVLRADVETYRSIVKKITVMIAMFVECNGIWLFLLLLLLLSNRADGYSK